MTANQKGETAMPKTLGDLSADPNPAVAAMDAFDALELLPRSETRRLLTVAVTAWFRDLRRATARTTEREVAALRGPLREAMTVVKLLRSGFVPNDKGEWTLWADATIEQHQARIDSLASHVAGCEATIAMHRRAIAVLTAEGLPCLGDLAKAIFLEGTS